MPRKLSFCKLKFGRYCSSRQKEMLCKYQRRTNMQSIVVGEVSASSITPALAHDGLIPQGCIVQQRGEKRHRVDLGPGSFRSKSRYWVDQNPRSRENVMRMALEELLGQPFPKIRPLFLLNPDTRRRLELDAYCESLRLAAEFHGHQHYVFPNSYHSTRAAFDLQQQRDRLKEKLCHQHGVSLLIVPDTVLRDEIRGHVSKELVRLG